MQVLGRGCDVSMAHHFLEYEDIGTLIELVGGETVAQRMDAAGFGQTGFFFVLVKIFWAVLFDIGCPGMAPGKIHCSGLNSRQYSRRVSRQSVVSTV
jgi:hypothetical protein